MVDRATSSAEIGAASVREGLAQVVDDARSITDGLVADYIPELRHADPDLLGVSLVGVL